MQYLGIIPAFMIGMAALLIAAAVVASSERWAWAARYLVGGTIGAGVGFVFVNGIYLLVLIWGRIVAASSRFATFLSARIPSHMEKTGGLTRRQAGTKRDEA